MSTKEKPRKHRRLPPHKYLPDKLPALTPTAQRLYNRISTFGVKGCYISNEMLAWEFDCCIRTIQMARNLLELREDILIGYHNGRTKSMWAWRHPGVQKMKILYYKGGFVVNSYYVEQGPTGQGVQKLHPGGAETAPKKEECSSPYGLHSTKASQKRTLPAGNGCPDAGGAGEISESESATPQGLTTRPAVSGSAPLRRAVQEEQPAKTASRKNFDWLRADRKKAQAKRIEYKKKGKHNVNQEKKPTT